MQAGPYAKRRQRRSLKALVILRPVLQKLYDRRVFHYPTCSCGTRSINRHVQVAASEFATRFAGADTLDAISSALNSRE
jgi:hypothetical protein